MGCSIYYSRSRVLKGCWHIAPNDTSKDASKYLEAAVNFSVFTCEGTMQQAQRGYNCRESPENTIRYRQDAMEHKIKCGSFVDDPEFLVYLTFAKLFNDSYSMSHTI